MTRCAICSGIGPTHATFCPLYAAASGYRFTRERFQEQMRPDSWPDMLSRRDFEGMSAGSLEALALSHVGRTMQIGEHEVWRWEESSPITHILSDGRPEGRVVLPEAWCIRHPDLGGPESALKRAVQRWAGAGRWWTRDEVLGGWDIVIRWRTGGEKPGQALTHYAGEPIG